MLLSKDGVENLLNVKNTSQISSTLIYIRLLQIYSAEKTQHTCINTQQTVVNPQGGFTKLR